jgi:hypothetical protein
MPVTPKRLIKVNKNCVISMSLKMVGRDGPKNGNATKQQHGLRTSWTGFAGVYRQQVFS